MVGTGCHPEWRLLDNELPRDNTGCQSPDRNSDYVRDDETKFILGYESFGGSSNRMEGCDSKRPAKDEKRSTKLFLNSASAIESNGILCLFNRFFARIDDMSPPKPSLETSSQSFCTPSSISSASSRTIMTG